MEKTYFRGVWQLQLALYNHFCSCRNTISYVSTLSVDSSVRLSYFLNPANNPSSSVFVGCWWSAFPGPCDVTASRVSSEESNLFDMLQLMSGGVCSQSVPTLLQIRICAPRTLRGFCTNMPHQLAQTCTDERRQGWIQLESESLAISCHVVYL